MSQRDVQKGFKKKGVRQKLYNENFVLEEDFYVLKQGSLAAYSALFYRCTAAPAHSLGVVGKVPTQAQLH